MQAPASAAPAHGPLKVPPTFSQCSTPVDGAAAEFSQDPTSEDDAPTWRAQGATTTSEDDNTLWACKVDFLKFLTLLLSQAPTSEDDIIPWNVQGATATSVDDIIPGMCKAASTTSEDDNIPGMCKVGFATSEDDNIRGMCKAVFIALSQHFSQQLSQQLSQELHSRATRHGKSMGQAGAATRGVVRFSHAAEAAFTRQDDLENPE